MTTADGDVIDSHFTFMTSAELEIRFFVCHSEHVDVTRGVLVKRHRLKQDVLAIWLGLVDIDEFEERLTLSEDIGIALLADLAFKFLPVVGRDILTVLLHVPLRLEPALQAIVVDVADRACTLTRKDEWVVISLFCAPTESALHRILALIDHIRCRFNDCSFLQLLIVEFLGR